MPHQPKYRRYSDVPGTGTPSAAAARSPQSLCLEILRGMVVFQKETPQQLDLNCRFRMLTDSNIHTRTLGPGNFASMPKFCGESTQRRREGGRYSRGSSGEVSVAAIDGFVLFQR